MGRSPDLRVSVFGHFRVNSVTLGDVTPRAMKARGLLALLIATPEGVRSRAWLQSKLWSDRSPEQAATSLRRTLSDIRKAFGPQKNVIDADFASVALDLNRLHICYDLPESAATGMELDPFDGIDVKDAEFEDLIRDIRTELIRTHTPRPSTEAGWTWDTTGRAKNVVIIESATPSGGAADIAVQLFVQKTIKYLKSLGEFEILSPEGGIHAIDNEQTATGTKICSLKIHAVADGVDVFLGVQVGQPTSAQLLWSDSTTVGIGAQSLFDHPALARLVRETVGQISNNFSQDSTQSSAAQYAFYYEQKARGLLFSLERQSLQDADQLLIKAHEQDPSGRQLAWRAFLRHTAENQFFGQEVFDPDPTSDSLLTQAIAMAPTHPTVQAICSQIQLFNHGDLQFSLALAQSAYDANSADPLVCAMLSNSLARNRRLDQSYAAACRAISLAQNSPTQYYFHHFACMSASASKNYEAAAMHASIGLGFRPQFTSLRRYQIALAAQFQDHSLLQIAVSAMKSQEQSFELKSLMDHAYPVPTLKQLPLMTAVDAYRPQ